MSVHTVVTCAVERHAGAILDIFNEAILTSTALYDYKPRSPESMGPWFEAKAKGGYPVIGLEGTEARCSRSEAAVRSGHGLPTSTRSSIQSASTKITEVRVLEVWSCKS
jgi:hypothetical protein